MFIHSFSEHLLCFRHSANLRALVGSGDTEMAAGMGVWQRCWVQELGEPNQELLLLAECCCADCGILRLRNGRHPSLLTASPVHLSTLPQFPSHSLACVSDSISVLYPSSPAQMP